MTTLPLSPPIAQDTAALKTVWSQLDESSCPLQFNFHLHTTCSDGQLAPETLIEQAVTVGLKGLAITDHHSVEGYLIAQRWLDDQAHTSRSLTLPQLWTGIEINANLHGSAVHILGYGFDPHHQSLQPYLHGHEVCSPGNHAEQVIQSLHQAGGLAILAHPARYATPAQILIPDAAELGIDGAEAYYAYNNPKPWRPSPFQTQQIKALSLQCGLFTTSGTDTHGLSILSRL